MSESEDGAVTSDVFRNLPWSKKRVHVIDEELFFRSPLSLLAKSGTEMCHVSIPALFAGSVGGHLLGDLRPDDSLFIPFRIKVDPLDDG